MRLLDLVRPIMRIIPEVPEPKKPPTFKEKMMWTAWTLFIYLIC